MNDCARPLDPIDCEALASGDEPVFTTGAEASAHLAACSACSRAVADARTLLARLEPPVGAPARPQGPDLASRVIRIRPFSRRERRSFRLWAPPAAFAGVLFAFGAGLLAAPGLAARDQAGLGLALVAPLVGLARALVRTAADAAVSAPAAWRALADAAHGDPRLGFVALLVLAPAGFALRRALARASRRG